jgi:triacylglycerol lipase
MSCLAPAIPKLESPIILVHGLFGFNRVKVCGYTLANYFPGIPEFLEEAGNRVGAATLSPTMGIAHRAGQLKAFINQRYPNEPVHIVAHSMGGLDSRYMIARLGMADRVLSLTTLGTPHRGSTFADWTIHRFERLAKPVLDLFDVPHQAFYDLTTRKCQEFNEQVPDAPNVRYFSIAGRHSARSWRCRMFLLNHWVRQTEGDNDGIVSLRSATYGEHSEIWDGDHLHLVNWPDPAGPSADRKEDYSRLLQRLVDAGFY